MTLWLASSITSFNAAIRFDASKATTPPLSEYTAPHESWSNLFRFAAALTVLISSPAATVTMCLRNAS